MWRIRLTTASARSSSSVPELHPPAPSRQAAGKTHDSCDCRSLNYHLKKVFADSELQEASVIRKFRITDADGKNYDTQHYNLAAIIAVQSTQRAADSENNRIRKITPQGAVSALLDSG